MLAAGCAVDVGPDEEVVPHRQALTGSSDDFAPAGAVDRGLSQARRDAAVEVFSSGSSCTGVLVTPRLVLTAAHCVYDVGPYSVSFTIRRDGLAEPGFPASFSVSARACIGHPRETYSLLGICPALAVGATCGDIRRVPDGCTMLAAAPEYDLALLVLAERVERGRTGNYPAVPMVPDFSPIPDDIWARLAGYGGVATGTTVLPTFRRVRSDTFGFDSAQWTGPFVVRSGDSGGPLYVGDPDDAHDSLRVLGIVSGSAWDPLNARFLDSGFVSTGASLENGANRDWLRPRLAQMQTIASSSAPEGSYEVWTGPLDVPPAGDPRRGGRDWLLDPDGDGLGLVDTDGDGVGDEQHDNCPLIPNQNQRDILPGGAGDGVGDAVATRLRADSTICTYDCAAVDVDRDRVPDRCDNCPGLLNADQGDCDFDGLGDACDPDPDRDGDGIPDPCDECPDVAFTSRVDSNIDGEIADGAPQLADPCDPNPVPSGSSVNRRLGDGRLVNDLIGGQGLITDATTDSPLLATMRTGFRFCPCPISVDDPYRRLDCASTLGSGCTVRRSEYMRLDSPFRPMTLEFTRGEPVPAPGVPPDAPASEAIVSYARPALIGPAGERSYEALWRFRDDTGPLGTGTLVTGPSGRTSTRAVFWALAVEYAPLAGQSVVCEGGACPPTNRNLNSHYWSGDVEEVPASLTRAWRRADEVPPPRFPALFPPGPCPACAAAFPRPFIWVDLRPCGATCPPPEVLARVGALDVSLTDRVDPALLGPLADSTLRWLAPSEPPELLTVDHLVRAVGVDAATLAPRTVLLVDRTLHRPLPQPKEKPPNDPPLAFPVLRASRDQYLIVGGDPRPPVLTRVALLTGEVSALPLDGELPGHVLAATLDANRSRLLVLDLRSRERDDDEEARRSRGRHAGHGERDHGEEIRLLGVDLETGACRVLWRHARRGPFDRFALVAAPDGSFVLAASSRRARRHLLLWLLVEEREGIVVRGSVAEDGLLVGQPVADGRGVSLAVLRQRSRSWELVGTPWSDFHRGSERDLEEVF